MKARIRIIVTIAAGILFVATKLTAQSFGEAGLLGRSHAGVDLTYIDHTGSRLDKSRGASGDINLPVTPKFDFKLRYDYSYASGNNYSVSGNALTASLLTYHHTEYGKAYFSGGLGHAWDRVKAAGVSSRENGGLWAVRTGYEVPWGEHTAINAGLGYSDVFDGRSTRNQTMDFRLEANHWFSSEVAGVVSATFQHIKHTPDAALFTFGLRWSL